MAYYLLLEYSSTRKQLQLLLNHAFICPHITLSRISRDILTKSPLVAGLVGSLRAVWYTVAYQASKMMNVRCRIMVFFSIIPLRRV